LAMIMSLMKMSKGFVLEFMREIPDFRHDDMRDSRMRKPLLRVRGCDFSP